MKNTTRIITLVVAIAAIVGCILSVTASAAPAKIYGGAGVSAGQYLNEYATSVVYREDTVEGSYSKPDYFKNSGIAIFSGEKVPGEADLRQGAKHIYSDDIGTSGIITLNYGARKDVKTVPDTTPVSSLTRPYGTIVFSSTTAAVNPLNGYVIEFDFGVHSFLDDKGTREEEDDEWLWEFPGVPTESGGTIGESVWLEFLASGSASNTNSLGQSLYSGTFLTINRIKNEKAFELKFSGAEPYRVEGDEWVHITWVFDADNWTFSMYVGDDLDGRTLLGTINVTYENYPVNFRVGGRCTFGQMSFDNVLTYAGTKVHDPKYFERMSGPEKFCFFVDCLADDTLGEAERYLAYSLAKNLYENQPEIKNIDDIDVVTSIKVYENMIANEELIDALKAIAAKNNSVDFYNRATKGS